MLSIDTEAMKQMVSLVQAANEEIDTAADLMNRITSHNDWGCRERTQINEAILNCRNLVKLLQESNHSLFRIVKQVLDEFVAEESNISQLFQSVEGILSKVIPIVSVGIVSGVPGLITGKAIEGIINKDIDLQKIIDATKQPSVIIDPIPWRSAATDGAVPIVAEQPAAKSAISDINWLGASAKDFLFPDGNSAKSIVPFNVDLENLGDALPVVGFELITASFDAAH